MDGKNSPRLPYGVHLIPRDTTPASNLQAVRDLRMRLASSQPRRDLLRHQLALPLSSLELALGLGNALVLT
jgi:hypothetical protein